MGNSLRRKVNSYELDQYSKVPLTSLSDDSDEEDVIYGHNVETGKIELQLMPPQNGLYVHKSKPQPKIVKPDPKNKTIFCWMCCILTTCIVISAVGVFKWSANENSDKHNKHLNSSLIPFNSTLFPNMQKTGNSKSLLNKEHQMKSPTKGKDWEKKFLDFGTESCVRLVDVDNDGILDILYGASSSEGISGVLEAKNLSLQDVCKKRNLPYPCLGNMFAIRGTDGEIIWKTNTRSAVIFINCEDFDVNKDGQKDCIVSGRRATIQAIDSKNGNILWLGDEKFTNSTWNIYQVLALPDFDNDGVPEVLITNGGDPEKNPGEHDRKSGRLVILSGATGKVVGTRYLAAPHNREIYMSPVMYTTKDGSQYILFGSGGETVPGDFLIISVPDLYRYVKQLSSNVPVPMVTGSYNQWQRFTKDLKTGLMTIYRGKVKGVMVPPVIVDVNKDGTEDILLSVYDGKVILLNGEDLSTMWTAEFPNMESYTSPAPGYFNDDDVLDFMVHWSLGAWPRYTVTQNYIIDGKDGSIMLIMNSTQYQMSSDLVLHTSQQYRDLFIFKVRGRDSHLSFDSDHRIKGLKRVDDMGPDLPTIPRFHHQDGSHMSEGNHGPLGNSGGPVLPTMPRFNQKDGSHVNSGNHGPLGNSGKIKRHGEPKEDNYKDSDSLEDVYRDYSSHHFLCTDDIDIKSEVFMFDRTTTKNPIKITETGPQFLNYTTPSHDKKGPDVEMCIVVMPDDRTTAAIGDVDGDGVLDLVTLVGMMGEKVDSGYSYTDSVFWMYVKKISMDPMLKDKKNTITANVQYTQTSNPEDKDLAEIDILSLDKQKWTQYMGSKGDSHYTRK